MRIKMCWKANLSVGKRLEKNGMKKSRAKTEFLQLRFKNDVGGNGSDHNLRY